MKRRVLRIPRDAYYTPDWVTDVLMESIPKDFWGKNPVILDPCKGTGTMKTRIEEHLNVKNYPASDIDQGHRFDATRDAYWDALVEKPDWVITNPPFNCATPILRHSLMNSERGVAMLLRLSYLEPCDNRFQELTGWDDNLRFIMPLNPRPRFRQDVKSTDSVTSCWLVWDFTHSWDKLGLQCPFIFN